jgi:hypothetical protein
MKLLNSAASTTDPATGNIQTPREDFTIAKSPGDLDAVHTLGTLAELETFSTCAPPTNLLAKQP